MDTDLTTLWGTSCSSSGTAAKCSSAEYNAAYSVIEASYSAAISAAFNISDSASISTAGFTMATLAVRSSSPSMVE